MWMDSLCNAEFSSKCVNWIISSIVLEKSVDEWIISLGKFAISLTVCDRITFVHKFRFRVVDAFSVREVSSYSSVSERQLQFLRDWNFESIVPFHCLELGNRWTINRPGWTDVVGRLSNARQSKIEAHDQFCIRRADFWGKLLMAALHSKTTWHVVLVGSG